MAKRAVTLPAKRTRGRPKDKVLTKAKLDEVVGLFEIGGTFRDCGVLVGVDPAAIRYHMIKHDAYQERVLRARALGIAFRRMAFEDSIYEALLKVADDPRYTVLAIFCAKAQLGMSDVPKGIDAGSGLGEILATIVEKKRSLRQAQTNNVLEYSTNTKKVKSK